MGSPFSYGDSRTYFRTQQGHLGQMQNQLTPPYWPGAYTNVANSADYEYQMGILLAQQQASPSRIKAKPAKASSSTRVIADMGFGGAESKPRSRRYAKPKTPATKAG